MLYTKWSFRPIEEKRMLFKKRCTIITVLFTLFTSFILAGCETLKGAQKDIRHLSGSTLGSPDQCESQRNNKDDYRNCLAKQIQSSLSKDDIFRLIHNVPAFKACAPIYHNSRAERWQYGACQANEFSKEEADRIIATNQKQQPQRKPRKQTRGRGYTTSSTPAPRRH